LATTDMGRKVGLLCPFPGAELGPYLTMWPGPRPTSIPHGILIHPAVWSQHIWAENWGLCPFLGELGPNLTQCRLVEAYLRTKWHLVPPSRLATIDMDRKLGASELSRPLPPFW